MKYFEWTVFSVITIISLGIVLRFFLKLKLDHFSKLAIKNIIHEQVAYGNLALIPPQAIKKAVKILLGSSGYGAKRALFCLCLGKSEKAEKFLEKKHQETALMLQASRLPNEAIKGLEWLICQKKMRDIALLGLVELYDIRGNWGKIKRYLPEINEAKLNKHGRARKAIIQAGQDLYEGDLQMASLNCSQAIKTFRKYNDLYNEGNAYLLLGTIYRISALEDISYLMLDAARKIFQKIKAESKEAEAFGNLGMLMVMQSRFGEAKSYFEQACTINKKIKYHKGEAEIINQQALTAVLQKEFGLAKTLLAEALTLHQELKNKEGIAFNSEISAHLAAELKQWDEVKAKSEVAQKYYKGSTNKAALLEVSYLEAKAEFELGNLSQSEKKLRQIIAIDRKNQSCFQVANAYSLLGLIFMQRGELKRAKGLFQQSLENETRCGRLEGMTSDYANIAAIEWKDGKKEQALKNIHAAIENAQNMEQEELMKPLQQQLEEYQ